MDLYRKEISGIAAAVLLALAFFGPWPEYKSFINLHVIVGAFGFGAGGLFLEELLENNRVRMYLDLRDLREP